MMCSIYYNIRIGVYVLCIIFIDTSAIQGINGVSLKGSTAISGVQTAVSVTSAQYGYEN